MRAQTPTRPGRTNTLLGSLRPRTYARWGIVLGLVPAAAIAAACGSSSTSSSTTTTAKTTTSAATAAVIQSANNSKFGAILVDAQGRTLYTLTNNGAAVACTSSNGCTSIWPPALLPGGQTTVSPGPGVTNVTAVSANGGMQLAYKGLPLYRFSGDSSAGSTNGDGITSFGGTWHVVKLSAGTTGAGGGAGGTATTAGGGNTTTTARSSGGGYGY